VISFKIKKSYEGKRFSQNYVLSVVSLSANTCNKTISMSSLMRTRHYMHINF
jgi:hypothetical protein